MKLLITHIPVGCFSILMNDKNQLVEVATQKDSGSDIGTIVVGRVEQVKSNINSAFIRISPERKVFLSLHEQGNIFFTKKVGKGETLVQGDELLVQIEKEAHKSKLAKVTSDFVLSGRLVVLTTDRKQIFISSKVDDQELRKHLKKTFKPMVTENYGFIIRTNGAHAQEEEIKDEMLQLVAEYEALTEGLAYKSLYQKLHEPMPAYLKMIRDYKEEEPLRVLVTDERTQAQIERFTEDLDIPCEIRLLSDMNDVQAMQRFGIKEQLQKLLQKKVWLKSGGTIVIEPTEALTVIDVNTEKTLSQKKSEKTILNTNLEAANMLMQQIRSRNLSGIIIVDFIDMKGREDREQLMAHLESLCSKASVKTVLHGMTTLGLVEITRKKLHKPIHENEEIYNLLKSD